MSDSGRSSEDPIRVCHVVNRLTDMSRPADDAVAMQRHTSLDVGILAWFGPIATDLQDQVRTHCVDAPGTVLETDSETISNAVDILSAYDVVHAHHPHSATFAKLLAHHLDLSTVYTYGTPSFRYSLQGRLSNGLTNVLADKITCNSPAVRDSLKRWERWAARGNSIDIVYTGIDGEETRAAQSISWSMHDVDAVPDSGLLVGHAGRLIEAKQQDVLIRGVAEAARQIDAEVTLVIAGDGDWREYLAEVAVEEGFEENVIFLGRIPRERAYKLMGDVDVFAMPSKWEGFSSSATEAMSVGTPCLFSDIQAFRAPFDGAAKFHPVGDSDQLANELAELLSDTAVREQFGTLGRKRVDERFTIKKTAEAFERIYETIV